MDLWYAEVEKGRYPHVIRPLLSTRGSDETNSVGKALCCIIAQFSIGATWVSLLQR
jgi:hypothetical protein